MSIKKLPDSVITRIAAGEVITSPYNVLKELLENSIDAGSTSIVVNINSTFRNLSIRDNGSGIVKEDLEYLCLNHYTSKISCTEDLKMCGAVKSLGSFGFRGEALHSISLCSHLRVRTKSRTDSIDDACDGTGCLAIYNGQKVSEVKEIAFEGYGTLIEINDIFHNNQIREEHFYKNRAELSNCVSLLKSYGCIFPGIECRIDNKSVIESDNSLRTISHHFEDSPVDNTVLDNRISYIMKNFIEKPGSGCIFVRASEKYVLLATNPEISLKSFIFILFINNRLVKNNSLKSKVLQKYRSTPEGGRGQNPFVFIEIFLDFIDVNVHPSKAEVIIGEGEIFDIILEELENSLSNRSHSIHSMNENPSTHPGTDQNLHSYLLRDSTVGNENHSTHTNIDQDARANEKADAVIDTAENASSITNNHASIDPHLSSQSTLSNPLKIYSSPATRALDEATKPEKSQLRRFSLVSLREISHEIVEVDTQFVKNLVFVGDVGKLDELVKQNDLIQQEDIPNSQDDKNTLSESIANADRSSQSEDVIDVNNCKESNKKNGLDDIGRSQIENGIVQEHVDNIFEDTPAKTPSNGYIFAQHQINLIKIERERFLFNAFYQKIIRDIGNFECKELEVPIKTRIEENLWDLLREYFSIYISDGFIVGVPVIYSTACEELPDFKVIKSNEKQTLKNISQELAVCYSLWSKLVISSKLFNTMKMEAIGTSELIDCCALMTDLKELYKGFDRC